jgi:hypothetical protein
MRRMRFVRESVKLAGMGIALDGIVELPRFEGFKPYTKARKLSWRKLFDGFLDIFGANRAGLIAFWRES